MHKALPVLMLLLAIAACGQPKETRESTSDLRTFDVQDGASPDAPSAPSPSPQEASAARMAQGPGIAVTAAPGVAFNYRYAFRLPGERVAAVQEQHAAACEKLGLDRCRITGMRYRVVNEQDVEAMLAFKLDPAIARAFGNQGVAVVTQADGMLVDSEISGEDVGTDIAASNRAETQYDEDLARVETQLARPGLRAAERAELQAQARQLRDSIRATQANRADKREMLAKTPMVFAYGSGDLVPGFDTDSTFAQALEDAGDNLVGGISVMLVIAVTLLPWALLALLGWWLWRRFRPAPVRAAPSDRRETLDA